MLFMSISTWEPENRNEMVARRAANGPMIYGDFKLLHEWVGGNYIVRIFESDNVQDIFKGLLAWSDLMKINIMPVMETEDIMKLT